jgi:Zn-finger nucleic acid-binding protein
MCRDVMMVIEYELVEVDYCASCQGVWLDAGELELLLGDEAVLEKLLTTGQPEAGADEKKRPCPACDAAMAKDVVGSDPPVVYDRCPNGHGLWFDKGELGTVLQYGEDLAGGKQVSTFLRDVFTN